MTVQIQCTKWVVVLPAEQEAAAAAIALILTAQLHTEQIEKVAA